MCDFVNTSLQIYLFLSVYTWNNQITDYYPKYPLVLTE